ncbi:hypothetical protein ACLB2K_006759 [Fragaria x ananassa]
MSLQGSGVIDGRGDKWWQLPCKLHIGVNGTTLPGPCDSPVAIRFFMSSNLTVQGLRIKNSPQFHQNTQLHRGELKCGFLSRTDRCIFMWMIKSIKVVAMLILSTTFQYCEGAVVSQNCLSSLLDEEKGEFPFRDRESLMCSPI